MRFYLGTHHTEWAGRTEAPLFFSARRLRVRRACPARGPWCCDSGGFFEVGQHGRYLTTPARYCRELDYWTFMMGRPCWAACQDWMCEDRVLAKTGLTVGDHQRLTVESFLQLVGLAPRLPWAPVLQGRRTRDYLRHVEMYGEAGVNLAAQPVVGVGSVCQRQGTPEVAEIFRELHACGLRLHGFGLKVLGLPACARYLASADSMAWSRRARFAWDRGGVRLCGVDDHRGGCANCFRWAMAWREDVLKLCDGGSHEAPAAVAHDLAAQRG